MCNSRIYSNATLFGASCLYHMYLIKWPVHSRTLFCILYLSCNQGLFELLLPRYQLEPAWPLFSALWHQQCIFSLSPIILYKPWRWLYVKTPVGQQFQKYSHQLIWHKQTCHVQSHLIHRSSTFQCSVWSSADILDHDYIHKSYHHTIGLLCICVSMELNRCT